jgi:tRNA1(Val) A37 N6-methylase TrmN6
MDVPRLANLSLRKDGRLHVVIPFSVAYMFIELANRQGLFVHRKLDIKHTYDSVVSLVLLELSHHIVKPDQQTLILYNTITPTQEYRRLCENFIEI